MEESIIDHYIGSDGIAIDIVMLRDLNGCTIINHYISKSYSERNVIDPINHRINGPAKIRFKDNIMTREEWYIHGSHHRLDGPAIVSYAGKCFHEMWYRNGNCHREDGPAKIFYSDNMIRSCGWYHEGIIHNDDGPAEIIYYSNGEVNEERWFRHGFYHRIDKPAIIKYSSIGIPTEWEWYINGLNRSDIVSWLVHEGRSYGIPVAWWNWDEDDEILFKLVFPNIDGG